MYASLSQLSASHLARTRRYRRCRQMLYAASHPAASVKRAPDTRRSLSAARSILWMTSPSSTRSATSSDGKLRTCGPLAELLSCSSAAAGSFSPSHTLGSPERLHASIAAAMLIFIFFSLFSLSRSLSLSSQRPLLRGKQRGALEGEVQVCGQGGGEQVAHG